MTAHSDRGKVAHMVYDDQYPGGAASCICPHNDDHKGVISMTQNAQVSVILGMIAKLEDISESDAGAIAHAALRGMPSKIWSRGDIEEILEDCVEFQVYSQQTKTLIVETVTQGGIWNALSDATDDDWTAIHWAIEDAIAELTEDGEL